MEEERLIRLDGCSGGEEGEDERRRLVGRYDAGRGKGVEERLEGRRWA